MRTATSRWLTACVLVGAGCAGDEADGDGESGESGETGEPTPTTGTPEVGTVVAPAVVTYWPLAAAPVEQAVDPYERLVEIAIVVGDQVFPGVYDGAQLVFADVPVVTYSLQQRRDAYAAVPDEPDYVYGLDTADRELAMFTRTFSGRPDVVHAASPDTRVEITATQMQPLAADDRFELYSYNADALVYLDPGEGDGAPVVGATEIDGWTAAWRPYTGRTAWPLVDPGQGDDLWLAHLHVAPLIEDPSETGDPWSYAPVATLVEVATATSAAMVDGAVTAVDGAFEAVDRGSARFDLRVEDFMIPLAAYAGENVGTGCGVSVFVEPGAMAPIVGMQPTLARIDVYSQYLPPVEMCPPDSCVQQYRHFSDRVFELEVGNPYANGTVLASATCLAVTFAARPETDERERLVASFTVTGRLEDMKDRPLQPTLGLVRALEVNGSAVPPDVFHPGAGTTPTITFSPPAFGVADRYTVAVVRLDDIADVDGEVLESIEVGAVRTADTTVRIPAGILQAGSYYYFRVSATHGQVLNGPLAYTHDIAESTAVTGIVTP